MTRQSNMEDEGVKQEDARKYGTSPGPRQKRAHLLTHGAVYTQQDILARHKGKPPSLRVYLHPKHFRLNDSQETLSYASPMRELLQAIKDKASDIHFEPFEDEFKMRYRIDGVLYEMVPPPKHIAMAITSRIKVMANLDIAERRMPQDGRIPLVVQGKSIDLRVAVLPTIFGESVVMRILDRGNVALDLEKIGMREEDLRTFRQLINKPNGIVLVTGPTGSGKTVSLYTCLNLLNKPGVNIATAEDPSEINLPGVNQVNVNEKAGLTFATALRAFLRQDPDIIMVGEIRDLETADISIKAAQTGHLVLSTLHTNDAPTTLTRMRNMGIAPFNIASSVILITAQRLARRLCTACREPADLPRKALLEAGLRAEQLDGSWKPYRAVGCPSCNSGYKGRVGIYQVMPISEAMKVARISS